MNSFQRLLLRLFFRRVTSAHLPEVARLEAQVVYWQSQAKEWRTAHQGLLDDTVESWEV